MEAEITFSYTGYRGVIQLYLISPAGTKSNLLHYRPEDAEDNKDAGNHTWTYMSVHFWGETASGSWVLQISSNHSSVTGRSFSIKYQKIVLEQNNIYNKPNDDSFILYIDFVLIFNSSIIYIRIL